MNMHVFGSPGCTPGYPPVPPGTPRDPGVCLEDVIGSLSFGGRVLHVLFGLVDMTVLC